MNVTLGLRHMKAWCEFLAMNCGIAMALLWLASILATLQASESFNPCPEPWSCSKEPGVSISWNGSGPSATICVGVSHTWKTTATWTDGERKQCDTTEKLEDKNKSVSWIIKDAAKSTVASGQGTSATYVPTKSGEYTIQFKATVEKLEHCKGSGATDQGTFTVPGAVGALQVTGATLCGTGSTVLTGSVTNTSTTCESKYIITPLQTSPVGMGSLTFASTFLTVPANSTKSFNLAVTGDNLAPGSQSSLTVYLFDQSNVSAIDEKDVILTVKPATTVVDLPDVGFCSGETRQISYAITNASDCTWPFTWQASLPQNSPFEIIAIDAQSAVLPAGQQHQGTITVKASANAPQNTASVLTLSVGVAGGQTTQKAATMTISTFSLTGMTCNRPAIQRFSKLEPAGFSLTALYTGDANGRPFHFRLVDTNTGKVAWQQDVVGPTVNGTIDEPGSFRPEVTADVCAGPGKAQTTPFIVYTVSVSIGDDADPDHVFDWDIADSATAIVAQASTGVDSTMSELEKLNTEIQAVKNYQSIKELSEKLKLDIGQGAADVAKADREKKVKERQ